MAENATILDIVKHYKFLYDTPENAANCSPSDIMQCDADISPNNRTIIIRNELAKPPYFAIIGFDELNGASALASYIHEEYLKKKQMLLHEVLLDHRPRKLCIDFDHVNRVYIDKIEKELAKIGRTMHASLEHWYLYLSSIDGDKCGIHAVSYRAFCAGAAQACAYQRAIVGKMSAEIRECVDGAFLRPKRTQNIRMMFSSKDGSIEKTKICLNPASGILDSLVQYVNECDELPIIADDYCRGIITYQNGIMIEEPAKKALNEWCHSHGLAIKNACGVGLIDLERTFKSYCETCKREHEHRGAFAIINKRSVRVRCRRADDQHVAGFIVIWANVDYRSELTNPRNNLFIHDICKINHDLTNAVNIHSFQMFVQSTMAFIQYVKSDCYYVFKTTDSKEDIIFNSAKTLRGKGDRNFTVLEDGKKVSVNFARAVEMFAQPLILYKGMDIIPYFGKKPESHPMQLNLWLGYKYDCGEIKEELVAPLLAHIRDIWCKKDTEMYEYVLNWFAHLIQNPGNQCRTSLIIQGPPGCGKSSITRYFGDVIGARYFAQVGTRHLIGQFNDLLVNKLLVLVDEAYQSEMSRTSFEALLKGQITEPTIWIDTKGMPIQEYRNCMHFVFTTNLELQINIEHDDRRYAVLSCANVPKNVRSQYFGELFRVIGTEEAKKSVFSFFAKRNISGFNPEDAIPQNEALMRNKMESMSKAWQFLNDIAQCDVQGITCEDYEYKFSSTEFYDEFVKWSTRNGFQRTPNARQFALELTKIMGKALDIRDGDARYNGRRFTLASLREIVGKYLKCDE